jgi:hypothetical protein
MPLKIPLITMNAIYIDEDIIGDDGQDNCVTLRIMVTRVDSDLETDPRITTLNQLNRFKTL